MNTGQLEEMNTQLDVMKTELNKMKSKYAQREAFAMERKSRMLRNKHEINDGSEKLTFDQEVNWCEFCHALHE